MDVNEHVGRTYTAAEAAALPDCLLKDRDGDQWVKIGDLTQGWVHDERDARNFEPLTVTHLIELYEVPPAKGEAPIIAADEYTRRVEIPVRVEPGCEVNLVVWFDRTTSDWRAGLGYDNYGGCYATYALRAADRIPGFYAAQGEHGFNSAQEALDAAWSLDMIKGER